MRGADAGLTSLSRGGSRESVAREKRGRVVEYDTVSLHSQYRVPK